MTPKKFIRNTRDVAPGETDIYGRQVTVPDRAMMIKREEGDVLILKSGLSEEKQRQLKWKNF